jgi:hypothetical protein
MQTLTAPRTNTVADWNWQQIATSLDTLGYALTPVILSPADCAELIALYGQPSAWRSHVEQDRYRLGPGESRHFDAPLPETVANLRSDCYEMLVPIANTWQDKLGQPGSYPARHHDFLTSCHQAGQTSSTPLITSHGPLDYYCLHQESRDGTTFPLQLMVMLSKSRKDYTGGEFLIVENSPRAQSRGRVVPLKHGQGVIWPTSHRPGAGNRGHYRIEVRHGVSTVHTGRRHTLGVMFHDTA